MNYQQQEELSKNEDALEPVSSRLALTIQLPITPSAATKSIQSFFDALRGRHTTCHAHEHARTRLWDQEHGRTRVSLPRLLVRELKHSVAAEEEASIA